jgi:hypothetical protein
LAARINNSNPLIGWGAANALRRQELTDDEQAALHETFAAAELDDGDLAASVRWRVVHALANSHLPSNVDLMFHALDHDRYMWVQYGAVRTLVEIAVASEHRQRTEICEQLRHRAAGLATEPASQLFWAAMHANADYPWPDAIRPALEMALAAATGQEVERMQRRMSRFNEWARALPPSAGSTA